jgi:hypothetical protein
MTSTSNSSPPFPKDPDDPSPLTDSTGSVESGDTVDRVTQAEPAELKPEDVFKEQPKSDGGRPEPGDEPVKPADTEELSPEELRLMADTMPGEGPGGD